MIDESLNALDHRDEIAAHLQRHLPVVFLDYDGTLTPIVARPELAILDPEMRNTVARLSRGVTTAIISGRACAEVRALVGIDGLYYAGNHGLEIEGPGGVAHCRFGEEYREDVQCYAAEIGEVSGAIDGVLVENKDLSLSVHYRLAAPDRAAEIEAAVDRLLIRFPRLHKRRGKKVFEIRPGIDWHKGKAVMWLLQALHAEREVAIYIGDDETDEDAFRELHGTGLGLLVGRTPATLADYWLADPGEVRDFLEVLVGLAGQA
ncbi:MAG: trehalose-phosphatase [Gammaproteobacteria bacterium]|nr:trehalose-phosphatase [Gammaproteobacteria bacterium]